MKNLKISESAFLVNESRSRRTNISKDIYSHLWTNTKTNKLWNEFSKKVYPNDDIELSIRNRFFLEKLQTFVDNNSNPIFINIAAGFTSYPFLLHSPCRYVEIDYKDIITYKSRMVKKWIKEGLLPNRNIIFLSADLSEINEVNKTNRKLSEIIKNDLSFVLLEGISYYLDIKSLDFIFRNCMDIQKADSILAFDFWQSQNEFHPVFKRLRNFFSERFDFHFTKYNLFNEDYIKNIKGYEIIEIKCVQELEKLYSNTDLLKNYREILPENYAILKRQI